MVHGLDNVGTASEAVSVKTDAAGFERYMAPVNYIVTIVASLALVVASFVLTYSVASRYFFHFSTDWQDEFSVFLIVGAVFMSAAAVQARRGHVAIEAVSAMMPPRANRIRPGGDVLTSRGCAWVGHHPTDPPGFFGPSPKPPRAAAVLG